MLNNFTVLFMDVLSRPDWIYNKCMRKYAVLFMVIAMLGSVVYAANPRFIAYISSHKQPWALQLVERMEVEFKDGFRFYVTSNSPEAINISATEIENIIDKAYLRKLKNVVKITHNHLVSPTMSAADFEMMNMLRSFGWKGQFIIWCKGELFVQ